MPTPAPRLLASALLLVLAVPAPAQEARVLGTHRGDVRGLAFSPDGKRLASGAGDGLVRVWDVAKGTAALTLKHGGGVLAVAFSPDGKRLASAGYDNAVRAWSADTGKLEWQYTHVGLAHTVAFSPDGRRLASGGYDRLVRVRDVASGRELRVVPADTLAAVYGVAWSPDGKTIAAAAHDGSVRLCEADSGRALNRLAGHSQLVIGTAFSPDGRSLLSWSSDRTALLWEVSTGQVRLVLRGHSGPVRCAAFSPDGRTVASCGYTGEVFLWDALTGRLLRRLKGHSGIVWWLAFSPDGKALAAAGEDRKVLLWKVGDVTGRALPQRKLTEAERDKAWEMLDGRDALSAYQALGRLVEGASSAVPLLKDQVRPVPRAPAANAKRVGALIADLDAAGLDQRKKAMEDLARLGHRVKPFLRQALARADDADVKLRLLVLLRQLEGAEPRPESDRVMRALEVLERIGSQDAVAVLRAVAEGDADAGRTRHARAALARLAKRAP
jgi:Tol biopolymer transport system component